MTEVDEALGWVILVLIATATIIGCAILSVCVTQKYFF